MSAITVRREPKINQVVLRAKERDLVIHRKIQTWRICQALKRQATDRLVEEHKRQHPGIYAEKEEKERQRDLANKNQHLGCLNCQYYGTCSHAVDLERPCVNCRYWETCPDAKWSPKWPLLEVSVARGWNKVMEVPKKFLDTKIVNYFDYDLEEIEVYRTKKGNTTYIFKAEPHSLPFQRDEFRDIYSNPEYVLSRQRCAGINVHVLRRDWKPLQDLVYVTKRQVGALVWRLKDLMSDGSTKPGAQVPLELPYAPNEIWAYVRPEPETINHVYRAGKKGYPGGHWLRVGQFSEEQALAKVGWGPKVQPGRLDFLPLLDSDQEEPFDNVEPEDGYNLGDTWLPEDDPNALAEDMHYDVI